MIARKLSLGAFAALFLFNLPSYAQTSLADGFKDPPNIARPRVYWYWQNGNITKDGLTKDLEWMHRAGVAGVETFDVAVSTPTVVDHRLVYMQPDWKDAFRHAITLTDKLGMEVTIGAAPGWSQTGGPWVKPADAMKKLVWTETTIEGGKRFDGVLPKPPDVNGPFQDQARFVRPDRPVPKLPTLYKDQSVIAFRVAAAVKSLEQAHPAVTSSGGSFTWTDLSSGTYAKPVELPAVAGKPSWIQIAFDSPQTIRGVTVATRNVVATFAADNAPAQSLEVSDDGVHFTHVIDLPRTVIYQRTFAFKPVAGRYFRYLLPSASSESFRICRFQLHTAMPVNRFEEKDGFAAVPNYYDIATPEADVSSVVKEADVIDLTDNMRSDGTLDWTVPAGEWTVLRMGYALTGQTNAPAPLEATGYEVDKIKKGATKTFMDEYLSLYEDASGGMMGKHGVNNVATDSWEAGFQNWTDGILADFKRLRGYDARPWLPTLTGRIVQSSDATDKFLWDFRRTIADLVISSNFDQVRDSLHERGLKYVTEAMAGRRATIGDAMEMKTRADYPMGELWLPTPDRLNQNYFADIRDTASVANIYGKKVASAESITSTGIPWAYGPWDIKPVADEEFVAGINQFTLHVSVHQPNDNAPGLALGQFGMWFNRLDTWAEQARAWTDYIARSCYLMQQGHAVVYVAYFYGEEGPSTTVNDARAPEITDGYNYDFVNKESLLNEFSVEGGKLVTRAGMKYRILYLGGTSNYMTLPVLQKVRALAAAGAVVVGLSPQDSPSLSDDMTQWNTVAKKLWPDKSMIHKVGSGKVYQTLNLSQVFGEESIQPDFDYVKPQQDSNVKFYHRIAGDTDIYFVNNRSDQATPINATFRVTGKSAEIWIADRGTIQPASYRIHDGVTTVPLALESRDALFVVFREPTSVVSRTVVAPIRIKLADVNGPWEVAFQSGHGAPPSATFDELSDWSNNTNPGIKYFSGTATYTKTIEIAESALASRSKLELDLGKVHEVAEVAVNGKTEGIAWKPPYRVDITDAVKPGANTLSIKVVNLWPNRLIGDQQPGAEKVAFTPSSTYKVNSPLMPSGLIGPVEVDWLSDESQ
jgi:hypothetical protein